MKTNFFFALSILAGLAISSLPSWSRTSSTLQPSSTSASIPTSQSLRLTIEGTRVALARRMAPARPMPPASGLPAQSPIWTTGARLRHGLGWVKGTLKLNRDGVEFQAPKNASLHWQYVQIQTLNLYPRQIILTGYEKRGRLRPGVRRYRFELTLALPPAVAAQLVRQVGRPSRNGDPDPDSPAFSIIPAQHRTAFGGTKSNGVLRFGNGGIEYVTQSPKDSRSWRWADIQTLSSLDPYRLVLFGYRDTYSFGLKQPMTRDLLNRLTDEIYRHHPLDRGSAQYAGN